MLIVYVKVDARAPHQRNAERTEFYNLNWKLGNLASKGREIGLLHILPRQSTQEVLEDVSRDHGYCKCPSDTEHIILPPKVHPFSLLALEDDQIKVIDKLRSNPIGFWEQAPMV